MTKSDLIYPLMVPLLLLGLAGSCGKVRYPPSSGDADLGAADTKEVDKGGDQQDALADAFASGTVRDPEGIVIEKNACPNCRRPVLGCSEASRLAVWGTQGQKHLMITRLGKDGRIIGEANPTEPFSSIRDSPSITFGLQQYLMILSTGHYLQGLLLAENGTVTTQKEIHYSSSVVGAPLVAFNENEGTYFVAWSESFTYGGVVGTYTARVTTEGEVAPIEDSPSAAALACSEADCLYVSTSTTEVYVTLVRGSGQGAAEAKPITDSPEIKKRGPVVAYGGAGFFVAWATEDLRIEGAYLDERGVFQDRVSISYDATTYPSIATSGDDSFIVAWGGETVSAVRLQRTKVLDKPPIVINAIDGENSDVALCFDGTNYLAAWLNRPQKEGLQSIYAARIVP